jgi:hypothetical protein
MVKTGRKSRLKKTTNNAFKMRNQWKNNECQERKKGPRPDEEGQG